MSSWLEVCAATHVRHPLWMQHSCTQTSTQTCILTLTPAMNHFTLCATTGTAAITAAAVQTDQADGAANGSGAIIVDGVDIDDFSSIVDTEVQLLLFIFHAWLISRAEVLLVCFQCLLFSSYILRRHHTLHCSATHAVRISAL
jgi:hypothetical protein